VSNTDQDIEKMGREALAETGLAYELFHVFTPRLEAQVWCFDFIDPSAQHSPPHRTIFGLCVAWESDSTYDSVKNELKGRLRDYRA
jgi:hypothetical protein